MDKKNNLWLKSKRTVRFGETDAAGVMHFQKLFTWCHEAWEESLLKYGLNPSDIFPIDTKSPPKIALPIVSCSANYFKPIYTGDILETMIVPKKNNINSFEIETNFIKKGENVAMGRIKHIAIDANTRKRALLPDSIELWLEASCLKCVPEPI